MPDNLVDAGAAIRRLGIFDMAGQRLDDIAGEMGAIGRRQRRALLALEVIVQDQLLIVSRKDQIDAGPREVAVEKQMRIRNDDRICRCMGRMRRNAIAGRMPLACVPHAINK